MEDQYHLQMHEIVFRSKTVGQPIEQRINTENCVVLCSGCHRALHDSKISIEMEDSSEGANGALEFIARTDLW
jgi:5,10-methylene-tetrahydrofolate dehydrogenase/methenyl tetrahydrofolate cyclohydrolase